MPTASTSLAVMGLSLSPTLNFEVVGEPRDGSPERGMPMRRDKRFGQTKEKEGTGILMSESVPAVRGLWSRVPRDFNARAVDAANDPGVITEEMSGVGYATVQGGPRARRRNCCPVEATLSCGEGPRRPS